MNHNLRHLGVPMPGDPMPQKFEPLAEYHQDIANGYGGWYDNDDHEHMDKLRREFHEWAATKDSAQSTQPSYMLTIDTRLTWYERLNIATNVLCVVLLFVLVLQ